MMRYKLENLTRFEIFS